MDTNSRYYRRVVTGHRLGKAAVLADEELAAYSFKSVPGYEQTYVWTTSDGGERDPVEVDRDLPKSALPPASGSLFQIVTFPSSATHHHRERDAKAVAQEYQERLPGLAETFERDGSGMHRTRTIDYVVVLGGEIWLELDDGTTTHLSAGDIVIQQATRHAWRNKGSVPATLLFIMLDQER